MKEGTRVPPKVSQKAPRGEKKVRVSHAAALYVGVCGGSLPKVPKTTKGNVLPTIHSPTAPRIMRMPPKKKYAAGQDTRLDGVCSMCGLERQDEPVSEAPFPPAPLQPMSWHDKGVRLRRKPIKALHTREDRIFIAASFWVQKLTVV